MYSSYGRPGKHSQLPSGPANSASATWACHQCNFRNRKENVICGGIGPLGCKAVRFFGKRKKKKPISYLVQNLERAAESNDDVKPWMCQLCGHANGPDDQKCGGRRGSGLGCGNSLNPTLFKHLLWLCDSGLMEPKLGNSTRQKGDVEPQDLEEREPGRIRNIVSNGDHGG